MDITCTPAIDRVYGRPGDAVVLCGGCGAVVPVVALPGAATVVAPHTRRG